MRAEGSAEHTPEEAGLGAGQSRQPLKHGKALEERANEESTGQLRVCDLIWVPWKPGQGQEWSQETLRVF